MTKPFSIEELLARITATLRRTRPAPGADRRRRADRARRGHRDRPRRPAGARAAVEPLHLTPTEFALLRELVTDRGKVLTHAQLLRRVWGRGYETETEYVRVYVRRLRAKLEDRRRPAADPHPATGRLPARRRRSAPARADGVSRQREQCWFSRARWSLRRDLRGTIASVISAVYGLFPISWHVHAYVHVARHNVVYACVTLLRPHAAPSRGESNAGGGIIMFRIKPQIRCWSCVGLALAGAGIGAASSFAQSQRRQASAPRITPSNLSMSIQQDFSRRWLP